MMQCQSDYLWLESELEESLWDSQFPTKPGILPADFDTVEFSQEFAFFPWT